MDGRVIAVSRESRSLFSCRLSVAALGPEGTAIYQDFSPGSRIFICDRLQEVDGSAH